MSFHSIAVCLDNSRHVAQRMNYALALAKEWGAELVGIYLSQYFAPYVSFDGVAILMAEFEEQTKKERERVAQECQMMAKEAAIPFRWMAFDSRDMDVAVAHMRTSDVLLAGQIDTAEENVFTADGFPEHFLLGVGRPMIIIPKQYKKPLHFGTVLLAWSGSKESARSVSDALPILKAAKKVLVVSVEQKDFYHIDDMPVGDILSYLQRHQVNAVSIKTTSEHGRTGIGEALLTVAADNAAGLIVMGAYGHSRLTEWVLGGVTHKLLKDMSVPVLMSH
jgi:nucleotide-binding universal stress UspA family protein